MTETMYEKLGISKEVYEFGQTIEAGLKERFSQMDEVAEYNQLKVLHAMQENKVSEGCFNYASGYGYNDMGRDTLYTANSYCAGQALFDAKDPTKLIDRLDKPFYIPESDFEKSGQYPAGTVFIEGLVFHNQKWFLYYGCADSRVAVAVYDPLKK